MCVCAQRGGGGGGAGSVCWCVCVCAPPPQGGLTWDQREHYQGHRPAEDEGCAGGWGGWVGGVRGASRWQGRGHRRRTHPPRTRRHAASWRCHRRCCPCLPSTVQYHSYHGAVPSCLLHSAAQPQRSAVQPLTHGQTGEGQGYGVDHLPCLLPQRPLHRGAVVGDGGEHGGCSKVGGLVGGWVCVCGGGDLG